MAAGNMTQNMPVGSGAPVTGSNINPAMLASLQNTANLSLMNAANNPNVQHLQNTLRQQQMMNTAVMSPATGGKQPQQQQGGQQQVQQNMSGKLN
jgi:hypothetical protein